MTHTRTHIYTHAHVYIDTIIHIYKRAYIDKIIHIYIHTYTHKHTHKHTHTDMYGTVHIVVIAVSDVNECLSTTSALCQYGICRNLVGSYRCRCFQQYGFVVSPDGKACIKREHARPETIVYSTCYSLPT